MLEHAAAQGSGARVSGGFVVVIPAARYEVASAVVENAIVAGAPGSVTLVDWRFRWVDKQLGGGEDASKPSTLFFDGEELAHGVLKSFRAWSQW